MYKVLVDCNVIDTVTDEDIEKAIADNQVNYTIMQAMGQSHREEYMKYILPFLDGEYFYIRRAAIQAILNIAVVTNTIPNTGISLPFISYGGSSVMFLLIEIGLVLSVARGIRINE